MFKFIIFIFFIKNIFLIINKPSNKYSKEYIFNTLILIIEHFIFQNQLYLQSILYTPMSKKYLEMIISDNKNYLLVMVVNKNIIRYYL